MTTQSDSFTRANEDPLAGNWETLVNNGFYLSSNAVYGKDSSVWDVSGWKASVNDFNDDQFSQAAIVVPGGGDLAGVAVRFLSTAGGRGYFAYWDPGNGRVYLYKMVAGAATQLANTVTTWASADVLRLESIQNGGNVDLKYYKNGAQLGSTYTDSSSPLTGGQPGIVYYYQDIRSIAVDDWQGGDTAAVAALSAPTPSGTLGTQTTATIGCTTTQNTGTFYCVADSAANLSGVTAAQIKLGQKASGAAALASANSAISTTTPSAGVTGLTAATLYSYAIVQNNANGDSNAVTGTFTTAVATYGASINLVNSGGSAYASTSFNWFAMTTFGTTLVGSGTTSTNGSGVLAVTGVTASGSGWLTGKDAATSLIVFGPTAVTFA